MKGREVRDMKDNFHSIPANLHLHIPEQDDLKVDCPQLGFSSLISLVPRMHDSNVK